MAEDNETRVEDDDILKESDITQMFRMMSCEYITEFKSLTADEVRTKREMWYDALKAFPRRLVFRAFSEMMETCEFTPKLSGVLKRIKAINDSAIKSADDLWEELTACLPEYSAAAAELRGDDPKAASERIEALYEALDPDTKRVYGDSGIFYDLTHMDSEALMNERSRFCKKIPAVREKTGNQAETERHASAPMQTLVDEVLKALPSVGKKKTADLPEKAETDKPVFELEDDYDDDGDGNDDD